jgi:AmpE protein
MALIVILICLALQRYWQLGLHFSRLQWLKTYLNALHPIWGKTHFFYTLGGLILLLLPLPILAGTIDLLLKNVLFGFLQFLFQIGVVWFCLNAYDYRRQLENYFVTVAQQDWDLAQQQAATFTDVGAITLNDWPALQYQVVQGILLQTAQQLFGVLFWYLLLGAAGAVGYSAVLLLAESSASETVQFRPAAQQLLAVLAWAPLRLVAIIYALAGQFNSGWQYFQRHLLSTPRENSAFIIGAGLAALGKPAADSSTEHPLPSTLQLVNRTLFIVLVLLAIFTLGGWVD